MSVGRRRPTLAAVALGAALAVGVLCAGGAPPPARAGDPTITWQTVETDHFAIHFDARLADVAHRVGVVAERAHRVLSAALDHVPDAKTQVVLRDETDGANGFANVAPRNAITLYVTAPTGSSNLADHDDWLYMLFAHEYTHILHLDTMSGLPRLVNAVVGKIWAPNQIMPRWLIEGLATYSETKRSAGGRTRNSQFDMFLRVPTLDGTALRLDQVNALPNIFPRGNAAYLYGSRFLRYVFDRFGDDTLRKMSHASGANPLPFALNRQIQGIVGKTFAELYDDWTAFRRDRYALQAQGLARRGVRAGAQLTTSGESNLAPRYTADGRELWWLQGDGYTLSRLRAMPVGQDARAARDVGVVDGLGAWSLLDDDTLLFDRSQPYRRDYSFQDLYTWDPRTDREIRLTRGARARDPAVSPDQRTVAFSQNLTSQSVLSTVPTTGGAAPTELWRGAGRFDQAFQPSWAPDGQRLAFSAWRAGGLRDILVIEPATGAVVEITHDRALDGSPAWSHDGRYLYFDSDRTGITNIYAYEVATGALWQVTDVVGGAFECTVSPDGTRLAYHGFTGTGYDVFEIPLDPARWTPAHAYLDDRPPPTEIPDDEAAVSAPRPYRALETLAPPTWSLAADLGTLGTDLAVTTQGSDAVGLHTYTLTVGLDPSRGDVDVGGAYAYSGLRPSVRIAAARRISEEAAFEIDGSTTSYWRERLGANVSLGLPSERPPGASWTASLDYDIDVDRVARPSRGDFGEPGPDEPVRTLPAGGVTAGVGLRVTWQNSRSTTYSVGGTDGYELTAGVRFDDPTLGSDDRAISVAYSARAYARLPWGRVSTLALRAAGAIRASDSGSTGVYGLGGTPTQDVVGAILDSSRAGTGGYLRGYPARTVTGNQYHLLNAEVRQPLWRIERGLSTLPVYLKRLHGALLSDVGTAFDDAFTAERVRASAGAALRLDAMFGYYVDGTFEVGYSRGLVNGGVDATWLLLTGTL